MTKKRRKKTRMQRSLGYLKSVKKNKKIFYQKVEQWLSFGPGKGGVRKDLFGIIDILAMDDHRMVGVQVCGLDFAAHMRKIKEAERKEAIKIWLRHCGLQVWAWRELKKKRGGKAVVWKAKVAEIFINNYGEIDYRITREMQENGTIEEVNDNA